MIDPYAKIHHLAHVEDSTIGANTRVWQFASVIRKATVGEECQVAAGAIIDGAHIGHGCIISNGAHVNPGIWIGDGVFIGPRVTLCNDTWPRTSKQGFDLDKMISGEFITTRIEDGASLGASAVILPGVIIGRRAMIAAGAVVDRSVPPDCIFKRSGTIAKIDQERFHRRMREVV